MRHLFLAALTAIIFQVSSLATAGTEGHNPSMKVYFYEFNMITYGSITKDNVEHLPNYEIEFYGKHLFVGRLIDVLTKRTSSKNIDNNNIRLKVKIIPKGTEKERSFFVDNKGIVVDDKQQKYALNVREMEQIQKEILGYHGVVDRRPSTSPWSN